MTNVSDYVIVGSGINSLVCAAMLAKSGRSVAILERNDRLGGCIRTEELTVPGFRHDVMSSWHPLFILSPAFAVLQKDLEKHGLTYCHTQTPTAGLLDDNRGFVLSTNRSLNIAAMNELAPGDGDKFKLAMEFIENHAELTFATLGEQLWRFSYFWRLLKLVLRKDLTDLSGDIGTFTETARTWLERDFRSPEVAACLAPWVLHTGITPDSVLSGHMAKLISFSLEAVGTPVVKGGSDGLLNAFNNLLDDYAVQVMLDSDVDEVLVKNNCAIGVRTKNQVTYHATKGVICSTTPSQLYCGLLRRVKVPKKIVEEAQRFRHGLADMQIHIALDKAPKWRNNAMQDAAMVHVQGGVNGVAKAITQARAGLLPEHATIVVGQPCTVDPSRAPEGKSILWIQLQELPSVIVGDAADEIAVPCDGHWSEDIKQRYADRIIGRLRHHIDGLDNDMIARTVLSPADLAALNVNLVGGDPYGGDCAIDQYLFWRPLKSTRNHQTPVKSLYHIGASTHPGPGLGGGSGYLVGKLLSQ